MAVPRPISLRLPLSIWVGIIFFLCVAGRAPAAPPDNGWTLSWSDEFDGTALDQSKWSYFTGNNRNAYQSGAPPDVSVGNGALTILTWTNASSGVTHSGWIGTQGHFDDVYGYWEARIRFNDASATFSAFWLQPDSINTVTTPADPANNGTEIDIAEHRSRDANGTDLTNSVYEALHANGYGSSEVSAGPNLVTNPGSTNLQGNWHTYGLRWTPGGYFFYIDGVQVGSSASLISMRGQWIYLSTFVGGGSYETWAGEVPAGGYGSATASTTKMEVDYVRYYRPSETILNADLEGRKDPWSGSNSNWTTGTTGVQAYSGTTSMALAATSAAAAMSQTVLGLLPNTGYVLTGWGRGAATIGANSFGGSEVSQTVTGTAFAQATVPFTTGATSRSANVFARAASGSGTSYVDDFLLRRYATANNGSFERGDDWAWNLYGVAAVSRTGSTYGGAYSLNFPASSATAGGEQDLVGLTPGAAYRLSAWANTSGGAVTVGVKNYGGTQVSSAISTSAFSRATVPFTVGASSTTATVFASRAAGATGVANADSFFIYQPLVSPWVDQDLTAIPLGGVAGILGNRFVMQTSGAGIGGTSDKFHLAYRPMTGNSTITAQVVGLDSNNVAAQAGVMIRGSNSSFVQSVALLWRPDGTVELNYRATSGGTAISQTVGNTSTPPWLRLTRRGDDFRADLSTDGATWTRVGEVTVSMTSAAEVGLAAASADTTVLVQPVFDNVSVAAAVPEVTSTVSAPVTVTGSSTRLRVTASAYDNTVPTIAWTRVSGPGTVTFANAASLDTTALFSQAGMYVLQCGATDSYGTGSIQITVVVTNPADATLALWLKLNESAGTTASDSSGTNNAGTVSGSPTWKPTGGVIAGALLFNGTDSYVTVPDSSSLDVSSAFTVTYWCYLNALTGAGLVSKRSGISDNNAFTTFVQTDGHLNVDIDTNNNRFTSNTLFATGAWYHVALVFDGSQAAAQRAKLYVNGVLDVTAAESSATIPNYNSTLKAGIANVGTTAYLNGLLDDIRLYNRALTDAEVAALDGGLFTPVIAPGASPAAVDRVQTSLASVVTNNLTGTLATAWTKVSGPGTVTFGNAASPATTVTFNSAGTYVLRLTASNAAGEVSNDLTVSVAPNPNIFSDWAGSYYPGVTDPSVVGPQADPDHDGVSNLVEWALGLNPTSADAVPGTVSQAGLPVQSTYSANSLTYLSLTVRRPVGRTSVTYSAEVSSDLVNWTAGIQATAPVANGDGSETVIYCDTVPQSQNPVRFIRLKVSQ